MMQSKLPHGAPLVRARGLAMRPLVAPIFERDVQIYAAPGKVLSPAAAAFEVLFELAGSEPLHEA